MRSADGTQEPFDIDKALAHLTAHGWTVHRWQSTGPSGAGTIRPARRPGWARRCLCAIENRSTECAPL